jgi:hypothetical protein
VPGSTPTPTPTPTPGTTSTQVSSPPPPGKEYNFQNTPYPDAQGQAPIPSSDVTFDPNGFNNGKDAFLNYLNQALNVLGITNPTARQNWINGYLVAANRESEYNSAALNTQDPGTSRGFMQLNPDTFAAFHQPGTSDNIYDPVANIAASINYVKADYGVQQDGSNLGIVQQFNPNSPQMGY